MGKQNPVILSKGNYNQVAKLYHDLCMRTAKTLHSRPTRVEYTAVECVAYKETDWASYKMTSIESTES